MALSSRAVDKAYEVFNQLRQLLPKLEIPTWPEDAGKWPTIKWQDEESFKLNIVYGFDRKSDDGWENLFFYTENPSDELKVLFDELKRSVPNTSISRAVEGRPGVWKFGWY